VSQKKWVPKTKTHWRKRHPETRGRNSEEVSRDNPMRTHRTVSSERNAGGGKKPQRRGVGKRIGKVETLEERNMDSKSGKATVEPRRRAVVKAGGRVFISEKEP